jgi:predicted  nucleic acid-binding Zn-ribbon protein
LRDAATKAAGVLKQASAAVAAADKALAEARRAPEELAKRIAKLKADLPEATRKAEEAKVRLEKEAAQAQAEMESAKAQAEKIRTGFEGKWLQKKA